MSTTAPKHDHSEPQVARTISVNGEEVPYFALALWAGLIIVADLPAVACPATTSAVDGLPIGVQVVTAPYHEELAIAVAGTLERCHRAFQAPPAATATSVARL